MRTFTRIILVLIISQGWSAEFLIKWKTQKALERIKLGEKLWGVVEVQEHLSTASLLTKISIEEKAKNFWLNKIKSLPEVAYIVPNKKFFANGINPKEIEVSLQKQWALEKVNAKAAWKLIGSRGSRSVIIAVLDTGVDYGHESLKANMLPGYDFKDNDNDPGDVTSILNPGHGTHCAGIAGAAGNVEHGVAGMSPVVSILPVRILGKTGGGEMDDAVQGIDYAIEKGAHVISASWSGEMLPEEAAPLIEAVERAREAGITFVTSSGNGDENGVGYNIDYLNIYPAGIALDNVITVAATDEDDFPTVFSNVGRRKVHIAAPGYKILSTLPKNRYDVLSGTSMAAPLVAGLVALIKSVNPSLSPIEIRSLLQSTGSAINIRTACNCRIDAYSALESAYRKRAFLVPDAVTVATESRTQFYLKNAEAKEFSTTNTNVAEIDSAGNLWAKDSGIIQVTARDKNNNSYTSHWVRVKAPTDDEDDADSSSSTSSDPYACPYPSADECREACEQQHGLPWCEISKGALSL